MFDGNFRKGVDKVLDPIGVLLSRIGVTANALTATGIVIAGIGSLFIGQGRLFLGFIFLILTGLPDALDGAVAKASGTSSVRGAFLDSVSDRVTDILLFCGIAWYLASNEPGRIMMLPVAVMGAAMLISYQRAKAESLGFDAKGGIMERAERFIVLALGLLISDILIPVLWVMLILTLITAIQRFIKVWKQATSHINKPTEPHNP
ncbi:MAG: CDP-alcohol phosphatidyltransferase family protein [Actinomycetota bacterium]|nr:CDP-alcohol phosphatidyltransferase family protein [Actinomycetota bacterium]